MRRVPIVRSLLLAALFAAGAATPASAAVDPDRVCVPFELLDGHLVVKVRVNGEGPYNFLLDTGASDMGRADTRLAAALRLPKLAPEANSDGVNTTTVDVVRAATVSLGGLERRDVALASRDYNTTPRPHGLRLGIIGRDFYADRLLTVDYPARQLRFSRTERLDPADPANIHYEAPFRIPIRIGEEPAVGAIDTGSNLTLHVPEAMLAKINADPPVEAGVGRRANTTFKLYRAVIRDSVAVGGVTAKNVDARFSALAEEVNIGNGFLAGHILQIDQRTRRVALKLTSSGEARGRLEGRQPPLAMRTNC